MVLGVVTQEPWRVHWLREMPKRPCQPVNFRRTDAPGITLPFGGEVTGLGAVAERQSSAMSACRRLPGYLDSPEDRTNLLTSIRNATRDGFGLGVRYRTAYRSSARRIEAGSDRTSAVPSMVDHLGPST